MIQYEIIFLSIIIIFQFYAIYDILIKIKILRTVFNKSPELNQETNLFDYSGKNSIKTTIIETINRYIQRNSGGVVDFHIIKDIVERNVDTIDEEVSNKLPTPLYLGLAGTMIGIIIGLFFINLEPSVAGGNNDDLLNISPLINGVKWAMSVSVFGLLLTTFLSVFFYKRAKSSVDRGKNDFLSQIQTELLPTLIKSDDVAIQELSRELRTFSNSTPNVVLSLENNVKLVKESIEKEIVLLRQINSLDVKKMSSSNAEIFNSLSGMMETFQSFPKYYEELNNSLGNTIELNKNLHHIVSSTQDVNKILKDVRDIIETGNSATQFFNQHIQSFQNYSDGINQSISETDKSFHIAVGQLRESVHAQFEAFNSAVSEYDSKLSKAFENSIDKFNAAFENNIEKYNESFNIVMENYSSGFDSAIANYNSGFENAIEKYNTAFQTITPNFKKLELLEKLEGISTSNNTLLKIQELLKNQNEILQNLNVQLPDNVNLNVNNEKGLNYYFKTAAIFIASISITAISIYFAYKLNTGF